MSRSRVERPLHKLRSGEYPGLGDQLDELWRGLEALSRGEPLPKTTIEMLGRVRAVKSKFPKRPARKPKT